MTGRGAIAALTAAPTEPAKLLVSGGIGTGKTSALTAIRSALRDAGVTVLSRPPRPDERTTAAVVIDDAHLLDDDELRRLTELVSDPQATVVVTAAPLAHHAALTELVTAIARENAAVELGPLPGKELLRAAAEVLGAVPPAELGRALMASTAGLPFLLYPALDAARSADGDTPATAAVHAARVALAERLVRVAEPVLDTLLLCSLSPELGPDDVAAALRLEGAGAAALVDEARATGLLSPSHNPTFLRSLHRSLTQLVGTARHHDVEASLLRSQLEMSTLSTDLALRLAEHGMRDGALADELANRAAHGRGDPGQAARLYRAAAEAGATKLSAQLADALAMTGDCATAGRLADDLLSSEDPAERATAVRISASIAMHDGGATQAADLFRWLGPQPDAHVAAASAVVSVATGDPASARAALDVDATGPPTSTARAARSLADGLLLTLDQPYSVAMARLSQSITDQRPPGVAPDTAAALVTLVALHGGDPVRARSVIGRAVRGAGDDEGFVIHRHRLLQGWVRMQDGQLAAASADVATAVGADLHRRDALWAAALQTAIARRSGDSGAVQKHWYTAMEVQSEHSVDLVSLLPLGELWVAAARVHQVDRLRQPIADAFELLERLGNPLLWSVPLHWAGVHAGILANDPAAVAPHGAALTAAAAHSPFAKALAGAGRTWLRVLANHVDIDEVGAAARGLAQYGLTWDATRLASQAALQTPDGRVSGAMLQVARDLKLNASGDDDVMPVPTSTSTAPHAGTAQAPFSRLSDREREVAELLLQGMQYRDIGAQLLISAKTVEHHVARIRRRLGAESRSEMLSMLRAILG
ncbi:MULTISPECIES: isoniazid response ATPase/transcriptional regulator IniR [unclassified Mycobacterium]|uniref:isoniazid response ATPase/transcriptional regulator IniR n=1 Tax=unclassified Mycobacterium TaxID=2642494 RepID=UPI0029C99404|nr:MULTISPECIES: isoniazid response ATPase/transcriptional regulator IniR [unclassified Mycobacterium]